MLRIPPIPTFLRHRRSNTAPAPLPALHVTAVSEVSFDGESGSVRVTLDVNSGYSLVDPAGAAPAKWSACFDGLVYDGSGFIFDGGDNLLVQFLATGEEKPFANSISYAANPSDIEDLQGRFLAAFSQYAI